MTDRKKRSSIRVADPTPVKPNNPYSPVRPDNPYYPVGAPNSLFRLGNNVDANSDVNSEYSEDWGACSNCGEYHRHWENDSENCGEDEEGSDEDEDDEVEVDDDEASDNEVSEVDDNEDNEEVANDDESTIPDPASEPKRQSKADATRATTVDHESATSKVAIANGTTPTPNQRHAVPPTNDKARRGLLKYMKKRESLKSKPGRVDEEKEEVKEAGPSTKENDKAAEEKTDTGSTSNDALIKAAVAGITIVGNRIQTSAPAPASVPAPAQTPATAINLSSQACLDLLTSRKRPAPDNEGPNKRPRADMSAEDMASRIIVLERELVGLRGALADSLEAEAQQTLAVLNRLREENKRYRGE